MEKDYSNRELDMKFKASEEKNDAWSATILSKIEETHKERTAVVEDMRKHEILPILEQTIKTNGRVGILEQRADKNDLWRSWLACAAFVIVPISVWLFYQWVTLDKQIRSAVDEAFSENLELNDE